MNLRHGLSDPGLGSLIRALSDRQAMIETSYFVAVCPNCLVSLKVRHAFSGNDVLCKHCDHTFQALAPEFLPSPSSEGSTTGPLNVADSKVERVVVICPHCLAHLNVRRAYAGEHVQCRKCDNTFLVPNIMEPPTPANQELPQVDLFNQHYGKFDDLRSGSRESQETTEPAESAEQLAAIAGEVDKLLEELNSLREDHDRIQAERDAVSHQLEQLRGEHDRLKSQRETDRQQHQRLAAELATIREALGSSTPDEPDQFKTERGSLTSEIDRLREQVRTLEAALSARGSADGFHARRDHELRMAHELGDRLKEQVQQLDVTLRNAETERDRLNQQTRELRDQLDEARRDAQIERDRLNHEAHELRDHVEAAHALHTQLSDRLHQSEESLQSSRVSSEELAQQLRGRDELLSNKVAELERLAEERQAALNEVEHLRGSFSQREQELRLESDQRRAEIDDLRRTVDEAARSHHDERSQLAEQLHQAREQHSSWESERAAIQSRIDELQAALETLKRDHRQAFESERGRIAAEFESALGAERSRHAELLAEVQACAQESAQLVDRLKAEILTLAQSRTAPDADLEAARLEIPEVLPSRHMVGRQRGAKSATSALSQLTTRYTEAMGQGPGSGSGGSQGEGGDSIGQVIYWTNGMVTVRDERGRQLPDYQGLLDEVKEMILRDSTDSTAFKLGSWATQHVEDISRDDFGRLQSKRKRDGGL